MQKNNMQPLLLLHLKQYPILEQLRLEEALLRADLRNVCIINEDSPPAIVMGISGKWEELINLSKIQKNPIPIIRRFSGGGTVVVDENTLFVSFIFQKEAHPFPVFPESILRWTEGFYSEALKIPGFHLKENDYAIAEKKCGGNAQYLRKDRWLHHTTFLWDYTQERMDYLLMPKKTPKYRAGRTHDDFLCKLCDSVPTKEHFLRSVTQTLKDRFSVVEVNITQLSSLLNSDHRKSISLVEIPQFA